MHKFQATERRMHESGEKAGASGQPRLTTGKRRLGLSAEEPARPRDLEMTRSWLVWERADVLKRRPQCCVCAPLVWGLLEFQDNRRMSGYSEGRRKEPLTRENRW